MDVQHKLEILADAAKYDASCASSGAVRKDSRGGKGVGSTGGAGICHSYAPDGRCISLLKVLLTNACLYDCHYCINRRSSNVQRALFTPDEVVRLTLDFYKRNFIEGLFLSSGIIRSADYTMELVIEVARKLRAEHHFRGYIRLKTIPEASLALIEMAGRYADRISINIELPTQQGLAKLAPEKSLARTQEAMGHIRGKIEERRAEKPKPDKPKPPPFATGQSTQMLVGADDSTDAVLLRRADVLYGDYRLRRVYYSGFSPIPEPSSLPPIKPPPLRRASGWMTRRWGVLYRVLWRLTHGGERHLLAVATDRDVRQLQQWWKAIDRDIHKMHAFVRFRLVGKDEAMGREQFVAWFEPEHRIVRMAASFFERRFAGMDWSILTPHECAHWDGSALHFTPGVPRRAG